MERELDYIKPGVESVLSDYLSLHNKFENPPSVKLVLSPHKPDGSEIVSSRDIAIATAYQCYGPGETEIKTRTSKKAQSVAESTLDAGHHTTRLHTHFTWHIVGASRNVVHDVLHSYPFYNSEQQSQRYVKAEKGSYLMPKGLDEKQRQLFLKAADYMNDSYFKFFDALKPEIEKRVKAMYPEAGWRVEKTRSDREKKIDKLSQEIARYVLPIAQKTTLFHTLSELSLLRLFRASQMQHFSDEARYLVGSMIQRVAEVDPRILEELDTPLPMHERVKFTETANRLSSVQFDASLGSKQSILKDSPRNIRETLSWAVRNILGASESELEKSTAIRLLVDPEFNKYLSDVYDIGMHDPLTSVLRQASFTFATKLSHTADSQRQRHRMTPGATRTLKKLYSGPPDYIVPLVIRESSELEEVYEEIMNNIYRNLDDVINSGVSMENALMLLPNAHSVRVNETGDLFDWSHRWRQRLCYLAQEEIFFISVEQVEQVGEIIPEAKDLLLAPCGVRQKAGIKPRCPEGDRWCGQPVYNWQIEKYKENRLI